MAAQIEHLVVIAREKERLQSEVEIASEVQNQLFPHRLHHADHRAAGNLPARAHGFGRLLRLPLPARWKPRAGDRRCCGEGHFGRAADGIDPIHHAHAACRRPSLSVAAGHGHAATHFSTSSIVAQLNRQLYANTAPEKYATFFSAFTTNIANADLHERGPSTAAAAARAK